MLFPVGPEAVSIPRHLLHSVNDMTALHEAATLPESMLAVVSPSLLHKALA